MRRSACRSISWRSSSTTVITSCTRPFSTRSGSASIRSRSGTDALPRAREAERRPRPAARELHLGPLAAERAHARQERLRLLALDEVGGGQLGHGLVHGPELRGARERLQLAA